VIAIVDYGMGNLRSVQKALEKVGAPARIVHAPAELDGAHGIVLPGVGAFGQAMENLRSGDWIEPLRELVSRRVPLIGICLGMQLLFETSEEMGQHQGLGLLHGEVKRFSGVLKIPQMGWNQVRICRTSPLLDGIQPGGYAFFVHSYYCEPRDLSVILATTDYGIEFASVVGQGHIYGAQFHPEKSQVVGLKILENFKRIVRQQATDDRQQPTDRT